MKILGIDTSCDDTCIAVLEIRNSKLEILSNIVSSQVKLHAKYGGVYPSLAKREHIKNLPLVFKKAAKGVSVKNIELIGVTVGPGLEPCLWQGVNFAQKLARKIKKPIVPINHIEGHILANFVGENSKFQTPNSKDIFPAVCLVVSGGHTQLILMKKIGSYQLIGETRDDAAGECFDKIARILGLGYPGGPIISKLATSYKLQTTNCKIKLPRPMISQKNYDFSFSGLKTAVLYLVKQLTIKNKQLTINQKREICAESQQAIIDVLIFKTLKVAKNFKVKSIILGGGVAANSELRKQFGERIKKEIPDIKYLIPDAKYCTDNGAMIAIATHFNQKNNSWEKTEVNANLRI